MMWISFAWTTEAFLKRIKTETRRFWTKEYKEMWWRSVQNNNMMAIACDKSPRFGGKRIGLIKVRQEPYLQKLSEMTDEDEKAEGGLWGSAKAFVEAMGGPEKEPYVIKFIPFPGIMDWTKTGQGDLFKKIKATD